MTLREYLEASRQTLSSFSRVCGVHKVCLSLYLAGKRGLSLASAARIVRATGGQVTFEDLLPPEVRDKLRVTGEDASSVQK